MMYRRNTFLSITSCYVALAGIICLVLLFLELKQIPNRIWLSSILIVGYWSGYILLIQSSLGVGQRYLKKAVKMSVALFFLHFFLNLINVYSLVNLPVIQSLCSQFSFVCSSAVRLFELTRMYRFITLSTSFLFLCLAFFTGLFIFEEQKGRLLGPSADQKLRWIFFSGLTILFLTNFATVAERITHLTLESWGSRQLSFEDRFLPFEFGVHHQGWIWPYSQFILQYIPENGVIFIPPQNNIWAQEGNQYYFRWFVYPRKMVQSSNAYESLPSSAEYVVVSNGGWNGGSYGWPKIHIDEKKIKNVYLIDRYSLQKRIVNGRDYYNLLTPTEWGVIELNK
jgi:hypothetical protein